MSATPLDPRRRAPLLGEHTEQVLREFGFDRTADSATRSLKLHDMPGLSASAGQMSEHGDSPIF